MGKVSNVSQIGFFIEKNKKPLLYIGLTVFSTAVLYKVYKSKLVTDLFLDKDDSPKVGTNINENNLTISSEQAQQFAKVLYDACNHMQPFYGTDEEAILNVFKKIKNPDDFKMVYDAFGNRDYNGNNAPPEGIFRHLDNYESRDLVHWLRSELSPIDGEVYKLVKKRITSAGWAF